MNKTAVAVFWAVVLVAVAVIAWFQWPRTPEPAPVEPVAEAPPSPPASAPVEPEVKYPIESASAPAVSPPFSSDVKASLLELLGRQALLTYIQSDDFARRFVATVDNLAREQAPTRLWPVNPMPGRFTVSGSGEPKQIAAANAARYEAFVHRFGRLDGSRAVAWYLSAYPQLEKAYIELGYPRGHFNDRLVQVIDRLLATPEVTGPVAVQLTEVKGPVKPTRPWVRYEFSDPRYESLSSGQKMLLRMGPDHARLLKAKLQEIRQLIAR